ncbi:hypothetical protein [Amycolatopsis sulphurea]|uniref:hypothetical protein n=1 Tax=Amycolatopsis sulphurea TaxID=76022 RepID=UPI000BF62CBE|nr:hypothetical protein [Amycolatopsis sulphurea]
MVAHLEPLDQPCRDPVGAGAAAWREEPLPETGRLPEIRAGPESRTPCESGPGAFRPGGGSAGIRVLPAGGVRAGAGRGLAHFDQVGEPVAGLAELLETRPGDTGADERIRQMAQKRLRMILLGVPYWQPPARST